MTSPCRLTVLFAVLASSSLARADEAPAPPAPATPPAAATPPAPAGNELDFNLLDDASKPKDPAFDLKAAAEADRIARMVKIRRRVLVAHQGIGLATLGLLAVTAILGTFNYVDKFGGGDFTGRFDLAHTVFAGVATAGFATTAILGVAAPTPYKKSPWKRDAALAHKVLMTLATACMVAEAILGPISVSREGHLDQRDFAAAHMGIGWAAFATMAGGWTTLFFR